MAKSNFVDATADQYSDHERNIARWLTVSASMVSIVLGVIGFVLFSRLRNRSFRHTLLFILFFYDFGKSVVLLAYPLHILRVQSDYNDLSLCDSAGFFLALFIEGADIAILFMAIHTALLIFRNKTSAGKPDGRRSYRYIVYTANGLLPCLLAGLAFTHGSEAYIPDVIWCSLPLRPYWYRLVLSWIPRCIMLLTVFSLYIAVYIYVKREYTAVADALDVPQEKVSVSYKIKTYISQFPGLAWISPDVRIKRAAENLSRLSEFSSWNSTPDKFDYSEAILTGEISSALRQTSWENIQLRRCMIERQIKSVFIYPICYTLIWIFPFILQCHRLIREKKSHKEFWMTCTQSVTIPLTCAVDVIVFSLRERPWRSFQERPKCSKPLHIREVFHTDMFDSEKHSGHDSQTDFAEKPTEICETSTDKINLREFLQQSYSN